MDSGRRARASGVAAVCRRCLLVLTFVGLGFATSLASAAVAIDAISTGSISTGTTIITIPHTTSGADRLMLVGVSIAQDSDEFVTEVRHNGVLLNFEGQITQSGAQVRIEICSRLAPDIGPFNVVVTIDTSGHEGAIAGVMTFTGVDQTTPLGAFAGNQGVSASASTTVSSAAGELVFGVVSVDGDGANFDLLPGAGQTPEHWDIFASTSANGGGSTEAGAASVETSWTWGGLSKAWAIGGISIKPSVAPLEIVKRSFETDGTVLPTGSVVPNYLEFKYLLYINNTGAAVSDVSVRDVLAAAFQYQAVTIQVDNSVAECALVVCTPAEELAIFTAVNGATVLTDAEDGDVVSYAAATIDAGNGNVGNLQLDLGANAVWAILFSVKMP